MNVVNESSPFRLADPAYHGVLVTWEDDMRLCVSPNGKRYVVQQRSLCGAWYADILMVASLSKALPLLPSGAVAECSALPEKPLDYPRPWASDMAAAARDWSSAFTSSDVYAGVIFTSGNYRLSVTPDLSAYLLQRLDRGGRWSNRSRCETPDGFNLAAAPVRLRSAIQKLPLNPADVSTAALSGDLIATTRARKAREASKR